MYICFGTFPYFNDVWLLPVLHLSQHSKLSSILWSEIHVRADLHISKIHIVYFISIHTSYSFLAYVFGGCLLWWGKVVVSVDTQRAHHFSTAGLGGMMNQVYLQELQSGPSCVASSIHSMLGWVTPLGYYCTITTEGFTSQSSLLFPATFTLCFVKSQLRV